MTDQERIAILREALHHYADKRRWYWKEVVSGNGKDYFVHQVFNVGNVDRIPDGRATEGCDWAKRALGRTR